MDLFIKILIGSLILFFVMFIVDYCFGSSESLQCEILDKVYVPPSTSTGYAQHGSKGGVVVTSNPEQCILILSLPDGSVSKKSVTLQTYATLNVGEVHLFRFRIGCISGCRY